MNRKTFALVSLLIAGSLFSCSVQPASGDPSTDVSPSPTASPSPNPAQTHESDYFGSIYDANPDAAQSLSCSSNDWYKDQVFYQIFVKAFCDTNSDGIGDLPGVTAKLPYLHDSLGVTAIWLSPIFKNGSSMPNLHGYDTIDYLTVDPRFGTLSDLQLLLKTAHGLGMRVIFDFVPNHVSTQNQWFQDSVSNSNGKRTWFTWKAAKPATGWNPMGGGTAFYPYPWNSSTGPYFYGAFGDGMPDLNYGNADVRTAMADVMMYWLNQGFDGMRVDAVRYLFEDQATGACVDTPDTIAFFQKVRSDILDPFAAKGYPKFMVGENWNYDYAMMTKYLSEDGVSGMNATMDFPAGANIYDVVNGGNSAATDLDGEYSGFFKPASDLGGWSFTFLNNHDNYQSRPASAFGSVGQVRLAQALQMTAWGTPILYYGNELGMTGLSGSDINLRQAVDWNVVTTAESDPDSLFNWQKLLDKLRTDHPALTRGSYSVLASEKGSYAVILRSYGSDKILVVLNLGFTSCTPPAIDLSGALKTANVKVLVGSDSLSGLSGTSLTVAALPSCGIRIYSLDDTASSALRADFPAQTAPVPVLYLRGTVVGSGWTSCDSGNLMAVSGTQYSHATLSLSSGKPYAFKVADSSWGTYVYGYSNMSFDASKSAVASSALSTDADRNVVFTPTATASYTIYFNYGGSPTFWITY